MRVTATDENPWPGRFRNALKVKAGLADEEIDRIFATWDDPDLVELGMTIEEAYGTKISDEDLLIPPMRKRRPAKLTLRDRVNRMGRLL